MTEAKQPSDQWAGDQWPGHQRTGNQWAGTQWSAQQWRSLGNDPELDRALTERALIRTMRGSAISGTALGVLAGAFLVVSGGALTAQSLPQLVLLGFGWLVGLLVACGCALALRSLRGGRRLPGPLARRASHRLGRAVTAIPSFALPVSGVLVWLIQPRTTTLVSVVVSLAMLSQLIVVLLSLRGGLRRAARRIG